MAVTRKTLKFLPSVFQTDTNQKFLSATMDQLVSEPNLTNLYGYIGRTFSPTYKSGDSYITEPTADRQDYQLEPSLVIKDQQQNIKFFASYRDLLNQINYYGGYTNNQSRLWEQEYYSFDPLISYDKFVNFSQYYWLPNGPDAVAVNTSSLPLATTYTVTRDPNNLQYIFTDQTGTVDYSITLARGGEYKFIVNQPGVPFWIQSERGNLALAGKVNATPTISSRDIYGVTNNGIDVGTISFNVPQSTAQDKFSGMQVVDNIDYSTPVPYNTWQNKTVSQFTTEYPQYNGIVQQLTGKKLVFSSVGTWPHKGGNADWTAPVVHDHSGNVVPGYNAGTIVSSSLRYNVWKVVLVDAGIKNADGSNDLLIQLIPDRVVAVNQKVYIKFGVVNANREFYKDLDGLFYPMPLLTAGLDTLWIQDGTNYNIFEKIKVVEYNNWVIDVDVDILGQQNYTSPNGVNFTSGLKIQFSTDVMPAEYQNNQYYVEEVGNQAWYNGGIRLVPVDQMVTPEAYIKENTLLYPNTLFPDYITINRSSVDRNAWSRNNRWFHVDVITATANYNGALPSFDQNSRGQRPIIQFDADTLLFNYGRRGLDAIDILDTTTTDAFTQLQGQTYSTAFGIPLLDTNGKPIYPNGLRVIFAANQDPLVKNKIYLVNLVQYSVDINGVPTGLYHIELTKAADGDVLPYDTTTVATGQYAGSEWWYDGVQWTSSQQKTAVNQFPLFEVLDTSGKSFSTYTRSTFKGTWLFGYLKNPTGFADPVLGFPLTYRNFSTQGDIEFQNYFNTDTFTYSDASGVVQTELINLGYLQTIVDSQTLQPKNTWKTVPENSKQYQQISYTYNGTTSSFPIDVVPNTSTTIPYLKVFQNYTYLQPSQWLLANSTVTVSATLTTGDRIDILVYSDQVSQLGFYQVPQNLDVNAQNVDINTLTLGQVRNHLVALAQNSNLVIGNILGSSNLRDIDVKGQGGTLLQHSAPVPLSIFLVDDNANFINALRFAQQEYTKFKNKFLELAVSLPGIVPTDPAASVDMILTKINAVKNKTFPFYYSDMVPYGPLKTTLTYTVFDPLVTDYQLTNVFNDQQLSNQAVIVYVNGQQVVNNQDFEFSSTVPAVTFLITLNVGDVITINEYNNTDGNYIPETPTKLGLWPPYVPEVFYDNTYRTPTNVIRGHDGSITPVFNDYRDQFLLELELRIFNNIKLPDTGTYGDILSVVPGKFRTIPEAYSLTEINQLVSNSFLNWIGNNKLDFSTNSTFESNDSFTWNYAGQPDKLTGEQLPGSWRACYQYYYDTLHPHLTPWEMLGFATMPTWWESYYGPAPYTGGNTLLWNDLEAGLIVQGVRAGIDPHYARPGLSQVIPVDQNGNLLSPAQIMAKSINSRKMAQSWAVGQYGPVEYAWRTSSEFPYAVQQAIALAKPGKYFGLLIDTYNYSQYNQLNTLQDTSSGLVIGSEQYLTRNTNHHITQDQVDFNGDTTSGTVYRGAGYINWIAEYLRNQGINPELYISPFIKSFTVNLAYAAAGFTDQKYLEVLAEQVSPTSTNNSIVIPNENYKVWTVEGSVPVGKLIYSAVIVEKTTNGYSVRGYDLQNSYFTIIPSVVNTNAAKTTVLNSTATIFNNYQNLKLKVPYGFEFTTQQQIADFLISYQRYLVAQGFTFGLVDPNLGEIRDWTLSVKEFLYWAQQGWKPGSILVLSPVADTLTAISVNSITAGITDSQYGSKVIDQNFNLVRNNNYSVLRTPTTFKLSLTDPASVIGYVEVDLVQYEHILIFDNTTVFDDVIYQPETGNRQYRLKLIGQKTAAWDGSLYAPGFIYSSGIVASWNQGQDYLQGDIVEYKSQYYTALQDIIASPTFQFQYWSHLTSNQIQKGLLPNFSTLAVEAQSYYDSYGEIRDKDNLTYSHTLIGYKPRQYLSDLGLTKTTQIEFYKGYIAQKGSANAVNQMLRATFNNLTSDIKFYEEWAIRVGAYGALDSNPYIEIPLNEKAFGINPSVAQFVTAENNNLGDGVAVFNQSQLYGSYGTYNGNIALIRTGHSNYDNDIPTAGYANSQDVDLTIFDLANYVDLDNNIASMGSGYRIWVAKDFKRDWNVYRVTETNNLVTQVANSLNNYITFTTQAPHNFVAGTATTEGSVFLIKNFSTAFDGFYQVYKVVDLNNIMVKYLGSPSNVSSLTTQTGSGILYRLDSMRFQYMEDARLYGYAGNPPHGWQVGEKIWIDDNAATTLSMGSPVATVEHLWNVYEKAHPWNFTQQVTKGIGEYTQGDGFGTSVAMSADNLVVAVGSPTALSGVGSVNTFLRNYAGTFAEGVIIQPLGTNTGAFGQAVDLSVNANNSDVLAVGAPNSGTSSNTGYVYIYNKTVSSSTFDCKQIIVGGNVGDLFGSSIQFNQDGEWLYVSAAGNNNVYAYGLSRFVPFQQQTVSVQDQVTLTLSGNISATATQSITQSVSGAQGSLAATVSNSSVIVLKNLVSNFSIGSNVLIGNTYVAGNISIQSVDASVYVTNVVNASVTNSIPLAFTPYAANDATSLLITSSNKTYIPNQDYTLSGSTVYFTANVVQSDITITQQPYYKLVKNIQNPNPANTFANFGHSLSASFDGAQIAIGAPGDTVAGAGGNLLVGAGCIYIYDRVIEAFKTTGGLVYTTRNPIGPIYKVTIDGNEVTNYTVTGTYTIEFIDPPEVGHVLYIEVNDFNLLERLIGVDSLENTLTALQAGAAFGTSLTVCGINCAIYTGAPYYANGTEYNSGAIWKFHNRGRLYGTNTGYAVNPVFTPGDSIRLQNFEVIVSARMMPTTYNGRAANILALSSNITAVAGQTISQNQGSGVYANVVVLANVTNSQFVTVTNYTGNILFNYGQSSTNANVVAIINPVWNNNSHIWANTSITTAAYPMASLDSIVKDVNDAQILGVTAVNQNGLLRLNSDVTVAKDQLRILSGIRTPGSPGVYADADLRLFAFMQIIVNPFGQPGEYFGSQVKIAQNAYMLVIGAARGTTHRYTTFDVVATTNSTTVDRTTTKWFDSIPGSGSTYIYELYDDPRNDVYTPGRYQYCQNLDPGLLASGAEFGYSLDVKETFVVVSAPGATVDGKPSGTGAVYIFENPTLARGWGLIRYQQAKVDPDSLTRAYLYNNITNTIIDDLQFIDPAKGRILGQAEQEISYKTEYDPAQYNVGTNANADINSNVYWGDLQVGRVWWNLSQVRYIDYEQDTNLNDKITYRSINWGNLFPGAVIEVCEWVKSIYLPSQYVANGGNGQPKYADNSAYVEITYVDPTTNIITTNYYYWVTSKTTVDPNNPTRHLPTSVIADYIQNPKNQGLAYAAVISPQAIAFYNVGSYLSADNTIMHLDYQLLINSDMIHSEYELVQKGNPSDSIPVQVVNKLVDSLAGLDAIGQTVPDPALSDADRYGIDIRPRQSMFKDRLAAVIEMVQYANSIFIANPIVEQYSLTGMNAEDPQPDYKLGAYNQSVATVEELNYIDTMSLAPGYLVLVTSDSTQNGLWVLYVLTADKLWQIKQVQAYKTSLYWTYTDWYATGYSSATKPNFSVMTTNDALALNLAAGEIIYVSDATGDGTWRLFVVNTDSTFQVVGIQNGTIQLNTSLGDFVNNALGFGNQDFDSSRFDQDPNNEIRAIVQALNNDIFIDQLQGEFNNLFFILVNYLLTEQNYVDWLFKSSFISVTHKLRTLSQFPSYIVDNQTYYQDYINEVKPYRTKIREYLIDYTGNDTYSGSVTDFDSPAYYDTSTGYGIFRSPSGEAPYTSEDEATWQTFPYNQWYDNRTLQVGAVILETAGANYSFVPKVTISSIDGKGSGATATAVMSGPVTGNANLTVVSITITNPGSGYITTPVVTINGTSSVSATAYAQLVKLPFTNNTPLLTGNAYPLVRTFDTAIKFDRTTYSSTVQQWQPYTKYIAGQIVTYAQPEGNVRVRQAYQVKSNIITSGTFFSGDYTVYAANLFTNASDRIVGYYEPSNVMPVVDTITVPITVANAVVAANTIYVFPASNLLKGMTISGANVTAGYITNIVSNVTINLSNVITSVTQISLSVNVSLTTDTTITATYNSLDQLLTGITYPSSPVVGAGFDLSPGFGRTWDLSSYDSVQYSQDGIPLLSTNVLDTIYQSNYISEELAGNTPEEIVLSGGQYIDRYYSHAPEELVPGITFDTLDMRIYTSNVTVNGANITLGYRIFDNMINNPSYLRISSANTTVLTHSLGLTDSNIFVANAAALTMPDPDNLKPGVIFIDAERITYWTANVVTNTLGQIRRGTQGTATATHLAGVSAFDASASQIIPNTTYGNLITYANVFYNNGTGTALDGTGLNGSDTLAANVMKAYPATYNNIIPGMNNAITTENAINMMIATEGNVTIYTET
jgi:hypothetical protein